MIKKRRYLNQLSNALCVKKSSLLDKLEESARSGSTLEKKSNKIVKNLKLTKMSVRSVRKISTLVMGNASQIQRVSLVVSSTPV